MYCFLFVVRTLFGTPRTHMHIHAHALAPFGERGPAGDLKASRVLYRQIYYRAGKPQAACPVDPPADPPADAQRLAANNEGEGLAKGLTEGLAK